MSQSVLITGNTYPVKDALKGLGGRWDAQAKGWRVPVEHADKAKALVGGTPTSQPRTASAPYRARRNWRPCGYPGCSPSYCDECDGEGYVPGQ